MAAGRRGGAPVGEILAVAIDETTREREVKMNRLTQDERRRVRLAQEKARQEMLGRLNEPITNVHDNRGDRSRLKRLLKTAMIVLALGGGLIAYETLDFHVPASIVEALLPRL